MSMLGEIEEKNCGLKTRETVSLSETLFVTHVTFIISRIFLGMVCVFKYITNKNIIINWFTSITIYSHQKNIKK